LPGSEAAASLGEGNLAVMPATANGPVAARAVDASGRRFAGNVQVNPVAPAVSLVAEEGVARPAAILTTVGSDGQVSPAPLLTCNAAGVCISSVVTLRPERRVYLTLFGSGWRRARSVVVRAGAAQLTASYAGAQGTIAGVDQVNVELPPSLAGGETALILVADGVETAAGRIRLDSLGSGGGAGPGPDSSVTAMLAHARATLAANPPKDHPHRASDPPRPPGNDFVQGYPGDDLDFTAFYGLEVVTGENGGYDTFGTANPADELPGAALVSNVYSGVSPRGGDKAGDRFLFGDGRRPYFVGRTGGVDAGFLRIFDLQPNSRIVLHGAAADYGLVEVNSPETGTAILYRSASGPDLVGFLSGRSVTDLSSPLFQYLAPGSGPSATPARRGGLQFGTPGDDTLMSLESDADGNLYFVGLSTGDLAAAYPNAQGTGKLYCAKVSPQGTVLWVRRWGSALGKADLTLDTAIDGDSLYAVGRYVSEQAGGLKDAIVVKVRLSTGELEREEAFGGFHVQFAGTLGLDGQGALYSAGIAYIDQQINGSEDAVQDPYLEKRLTKDLSVVKRVSFGPGTNKEPWGGLAFVPKKEGRPGEGTIFVSGWTMGRFSEETPQVGNGDVWLAAFDQDLKFLWVEQFGSPQRDWSWDLAADEDGFVYVAGHTLGQMRGAGAYFGQGDGFVAKFDPARPSGQRLLWTRQIGTAESDEVRSLRVAGEEILVSGHTYGDLGGRNAGESDVWFARLDKNGNVLETRQFGTEMDERAFVLPGRNGVVLGGYSAGSMTGANKGGFDAFVLPLLPR
jgi:uncharacterized protein (TIGR03437 family)